MNPKEPQKEIKESQDIEELEDAIDEETDTSPSCCGGTDPENGA